jgi:membrane-bound metal-dependent hydrolase YbcI (DUF457 family)
MDPVSHVALGYVLINLRRRRDHGIVLAVTLGALSPDIDVVLLPTGWDRYIVAHQAGTHSLIGAVICAVLAGALAWAVRGPQRGGRAGSPVRRGSSFAVLAGVAVVGALSHVGFDLACGASIRIWWPVADTVLSNLGVLVMADPVAAFLIATSAMVVWQAREARRRRAIWLLALFALFIAAKAVSRLNAEALFSSVRARLPERVEAAWGSIARWHLYSRTPISLESWEVDIVTRSVRRQIDVLLVDSDPAAARLEAASLEWETVRNFRRSHDLTFSTVTESLPNSGGSRVMWSDLRYCDMGTATSLRCSVRVGGEISPNASRPRLIVEIGQFVQTR